MKDMQNETTSKIRKVKWNVLNHINTILDSLIDCELNPVCTTLYQTTIQRLNEYFSTNDFQTWILCYAVYEHFNNNSSVIFSEFANFVSVNVLKIVEKHDDFVTLRKRNLINFSDSRLCFSISESIIHSIVNNQPMTNNLEKKINYLDFVAMASKIYENRDYVYDSKKERVEALIYLEEQNDNLPLVIRTKNLISDCRTRFVFYEMCSDSLTGIPTYLCSTIQDIYDDVERHGIIKEFLDGKHLLIANDFFEFEQKGNLLEATLRITEKGKKFFLDTDYELYAEQIDEKLLKNPKDIRTKKLFYSECNQEQIEDLTRSLTQSNYKKIRNRLKSQGLPVGIAVILYGEAGCGKTESVYQIAKKTGRAIVQVDISDTKSCWFGESEKMIKKIFTDYKALCKKVEKQKNGRTPILLFNECDAVFSKRKDVGTSSTAQVENAIQNIILEEMEKLDGILIATTNLIDNLDPAFERRFLFKIRFEKPSVSAKKEIWKDKVKWITSDQAETLAETYNLSGGEIDNVVRKSQMKEIVSGQLVTFNDLLEMCRVEKLNDSTTKKIGFM